MTLIDILFTENYIAHMPDAVYDMLPVVMLFSSLFIFLVIGVPIAFSIGWSAILTIFILYSGRKLNE